MATLFVMQGRDKGRRYELRAASLTLGRDSNNPIQITDSEISRRHAEIRKDDTGYLLADLASSNGTFVNAQQVTEQRLTNGDRIQVGRTLLLFTDADDRSEAPLAHEVEIVAVGDVDNSRIVKSVSEDPASRLFAADPADSPWLAAARSNLQLM